MNNLDPQLKELYKKILAKERFKTDRTGVGTKSIFGHQMRFDLRDGFPLTTLRKIHIKSMIHELLWFLGAYDPKYKKFGLTNIKYLCDHGVSFWDDWCYESYRKEKLAKYLENDLKDSKTIKKFSILSQKEFNKKIVSDDNFALKYGNLGNIYQKQFLDWGGYSELVEKTNEYKETNSDTILVDKLGTSKVYLRGINQINGVIDQLINNPDSRRIIVSAWNVAELDDMALQPCHTMHQYYAEILEMEERIKLCQKIVSIEDLNEYMSKNNINNFDEIRRNPLAQIQILDHFNIPERYLDMQLYQRSGDFGLGIPYNIASYACLLTMIAQIVNMVPREFIWTGGDVHIYSNHIDQLQEIFEREPRELPKLKLNTDIQNIYEFRYEDITIERYDPHPNIKMDVAV